MIKNLYLMMYISKTRCFANAASNQTFSEIKTNIHRSTADDVADAFEIVADTFDVASDVIEVAAAVGWIWVFLLADNVNGAALIRNWGEEAWEENVNFLEWIWTNRKMGF